MTAASSWEMAEEAEGAVAATTSCQVRCLVIVRVNTFTPCCCKAVGIKYTITRTDAWYDWYAKFKIEIELDMTIEKKAGGECKMELWEYTDDPTQAPITPGALMTNPEGEPIEAKNMWSEVGNFHGALKSDPSQGAKSLSQGLMDLHRGEGDSGCVEGATRGIYDDTPMFKNSKSYLYQTVRLHSGCPDGGSASVSGSIQGNNDGTFSTYPNDGETGSDDAGGDPTMYGNSPDRTKVPPNYPGRPKYWDGRKSL